MPPQAAPAGQLAAAPVAGADSHGGVEADPLLACATARLNQCDLDLALPPELAARPEAAALAAGFGNVSEAVRQAAGLARIVIDGLPGISREAEELRRDAGESLRLAGAAQSQTVAVAESLGRAQGELKTLGMLAADAQREAGRGREIGSALGQVMGNIRQRARRIGEVIDSLDQIAFQTNLLALNAGVEAARAGVHGRGFAVVAQEVRLLSQRAAESARAARTLLGETQTAVQQGDQAAGSALALIEQLGILVGRAGEAMGKVAEDFSGREREVGEVSSVLASLLAGNEANLARSERVDAAVRQLAGEAGDLTDCMKLFKLPADPVAGGRHAAARAHARRAAAAIASAFIDAVAAGKITPRALFTNEYTPVAGTDPAKFTTPFDALCDELLPPIQEPILADAQWIVFAISANRDGYVPTHNLKFSRPLTGDRAVDLAGNRTKRKFGDRVGRTVGAHTDDHRIQVYRRDTGEIMFDLSVPIIVKGRHWGGFRIGYRLD